MRRKIGSSMPPSSSFSFLIWKKRGGEGISYLCEEEEEGEEKSPPSVMHQKRRKERACLISEVPLFLLLLHPRGKRGRRKIEAGVAVVRTIFLGKKCVGKRLARRV